MADRDTNSASETHEALWLRSRRGPLEVGPAPVRVAGDSGIVVRARAVAMNPIDAMGALARRLVLPWTTYPTVIGSDVAGEVVAVGAAVSGVSIGDRVTGYAVGLECNHNSAAEGAFQTHVTMMPTMCTRIPDSLSFQDACVLPLACTTAAAGLFEKDQLALDLPTAAPDARRQSVLIFGGATSVGMNAIQLARNAGYDVVATASATNFALLESLGAGALVDYHDGDVVDQLIGHLDGRALAGTLAITGGSLRQAIAVNRAEGREGPRRIASAQPTPLTRLQGALARRHGITVSAIWGGSPKDTPVGPAVWNDFLPAALADGRYRAAPSSRIVGTGLGSIPAALDELKKGVRAEKLVVTV